MPTVANAVFTAVGIASCVKFKPALGLRCFGELKSFWIWRLHRFDLSGKTCEVVAATGAF